MRSLTERILKRLHVDSSIGKRLKLSYIIMMGLMLIPLIASVGVMANYSFRYHGVISQIEKVSSLKPLVVETIPDELWSVVAGRKSFAEGQHYNLIHTVNEQLDNLMVSSVTRNPVQLTVARRTMDTLEGYVNDMGRQIDAGATVQDNEALLEVVRSVAALVGEMLEDFIALEISAATDTSIRLQNMLGIILAAELVLLLLTVLFAMLAQSSLSETIRRPIAQLEEFAGNLAGGNLLARAPTTEVEELKSLTASLNIMAGKLSDLIEENKREQENLKKSELRTLQAQIAPHFLYNTLDAIVWLAEARRTAEVIQITQALSDFFRISLSQGRDWIPLSQEVRHLQGYLTIQKIRYRDILDYSIDIPEELHDLQILKLVIQPLVENAIYHGIKHRRGKGRVEITGRREEELLYFEVRDDGAGMPEERLNEIRECLSEGISMEKENLGYGLYNVNKRLQLYYSPPRGLSIESGPTGTAVSFSVPVRRQEHV
jgi:two-component system sensor histidine kinase YesM